MIYVNNKLEVFNNNDKIRSMQCVKPTMKMNILFTFQITQILYSLYFAYLDKKYAKILYNTEIHSINNENILVATSKNVHYNKIIIICHSVCGDYTQFAYLSSKLLKHNNALILSYSRRGVHPELNNNQHNIVGCPDTLDYIVNYAHSKYNLPIYLLAVSAGTSLAATYLGTKNKYVKSAILVSPGYQYEYSIKNMTFIARVLCFLNVYLFFYRVANTKLRKTKSLTEYMYNLYHHLGYNSSEEYFDHHDPINHLSKISVPTVFINACDDFIFPKKNIRVAFEHALKNRNISIIATKYGSHIGFAHLFGKDPWIYDFIIEYFMTTPV